jgi:hypothetical protein
MPAVFLRAAFLYLLKQTRDRAVKETFFLLPVRKEFSDDKDCHMKEKSSILYYYCAGFLY